jgi:hypothetical protein
MAYNEQDCIATAARLLLGCSDAVHVFDHGSTDQTASICRQLGVTVHSVDRKRVPISRRGIKVPDLFHHIAGFVRSKMAHFDWVVWIAADEILRQPDGRLVTRGALERAAAAGFDVIRPLIRHFWMWGAEAAGPFYRRMRYFTTDPKGHAPRAWRIRLTPAKIADGLHMYDRKTCSARRGRKMQAFGRKPWPARTSVSNNEWLLDHYPLRSPSQARRKLSERNWRSRTGARRYALARRTKTVTRPPDLGPLERETRDLEAP